MSLKRSQVIAACLCLFAFWGATAQDAAPQVKLTDNPIYQKQCAKCHGKGAKGRWLGGPSLISEKVAEASNNDLNHIINNGKGRMPKYRQKLRPQEIEDLVYQIAAANRK